MPLIYLYVRRPIKTLLSETPKAFSLNAVVDVRRRHEMCFFEISRKLLELATSNFNTIQPSIVFTFPPEMTSPSTPGRQ